jgi:hypothetical protein
MGAAGLLGGLFGAHHRNAVAKEQSVNGAAQQDIEQKFNQIVNNFNAGMLSASDAKAQIDQAVNNFGTATASVRTGGQEWFNQGWTLTQGAQHNQKCNAACSLWSAYDGIGKTLKTQIDATAGKVAASNAQTGGAPDAQANLSGVGPKPGAYSAQSVAPAPGSASVVPGLNLSDPKTLVIAVGAVVVVVLLISYAMRPKRGR